MARIADWGLKENGIKLLDEVTKYSRSRYDEYQPLHIGSRAWKKLRNGDGVDKSNANLIITKCEKSLGKNKINLETLFGVKFDSEDEKLHFFFGSISKSAAKEQIALQDSTPIVGREWLSEWLHEEEYRRKERYILITAPPGFGKTTFFHHYLSEEKRNNKKFVYWFAKSGDTTDEIIRSLKNQIVKEYDLSPGLIHAQFTDVLSESNRRNKKIRIYIENIHEIESNTDGSSLLAFLTSNPFPNVVFVLSARSNIVEWQLFNRDFLHLDIAKHEKQQNDADIKEFIKLYAHERGLQISSEQIIELATATDGCFAMAKHWLLNSSGTNIASLQQGHSGYIDDLWRTITEKSPKDVEALKCVVGMIEVSHTPLSVAEIKEFLAVSGISEFDVPRMQEKLAQLLVVNGTHRKKPRYDFYHKYAGERIFATFNEQEQVKYRGIVEAGRRNRITSPLTNANSSEDLLRIFESGRSTYLDNLHGWLTSTLYDSDQNYKYKTPFVAPIAWYMFGHYWWDEFDQSFAMCENIIAWLESNADKYEILGDEYVNYYTEAVTALKDFRQHWHRNSIWKLRRPSQQSKVEEERRLWKIARVKSCRLLNFVPIYDTLEHKMAHAFLIGSVGEAYWGEGNLTKALSYYEEEMNAYQNLPILSWLIPYIHVDYADMHFDNGDITKAYQHIHSAIIFETIEASVTAECWRCYGDLLWSEHQFEDAMHAYLLSVYYAAVAHSETSILTDGYSVAFHKEIAWSLEDRINETQFSNETQANSLRQQCMDFWQPFMEGIITVALPERDKRYSKELEELTKLLNVKVAQIQERLMSMLEQRGKISP